MFIENNWFLLFDEKKCVNCLIFKRKKMFNINNFVLENFDELVVGFWGLFGFLGVGKLGV